MLTREERSIVVGGVLRDVRRGLGVTQVEIAARVGCPHSLISLYEKGRREISVERFVAVVEAMGADPALVLATCQHGVELAVAQR